MNESDCDFYFRNNLPDSTACSSFSASSGMIFSTDFRFISCCFKAFDIIKLAALSVSRPCWTRLFLRWCGVSLSNKTEIKVSNECSYNNHAFRITFCAAWVALSSNDRHLPNQWARHPFQAAFRTEIPLFFRSNPLTESFVYRLTHCRRTDKSENTYIRIKVNIMFIVSIVILCIKNWFLRHASWMMNVMWTRCRYNRVIMLRFGYIFHCSWIDYSFSRWRFWRWLRKRNKILQLKGENVVCDFNGLLPPLIKCPNYRIHLWRPFLWQTVYALSISTLSDVVYFDEQMVSVIVSGLEVMLALILQSSKTYIFIGARIFGEFDGMCSGILFFFEIFVVAAVIVLNCCKRNILSDWLALNALTI